MEEKNIQEIKDSLSKIASTTDINSEILIILKDIQKWIKFSGWTTVKELLRTSLDTQKKVIIYHLSDGDKSIRDIRDEIKKYGLKSSYGGIHKLWQRWKKIGIVESSKKWKGRFQKVFELKDFDFDIPTISN